MRKLLMVTFCLAFISAGCAAQATATPVPSAVAFETFVDFNRGPFDQQLGTGWYQFEGQTGNGFRWMSQNAELFLASPPAGTKVHLLLLGTVPNITWYPGGTLDLTVNVDGASILKQRIDASGNVQLDTPVTLDASVTRHTIRLDLSASVIPATSVPGSADTRRLGMIIRRVLFQAGN